GEVSWQSIIKSLESIRSRFFNGQDPKSNKASWVKWNKVLTPKDKWGLGAIYGEDGNLNKDVSGEVRTCWTSIVHEVRVLQGRGINVADYIRLKLGNGENTRFWVDNWYEGGVIKELFPQVELERCNLTSLAEISRMTTLPCEDRYVWTLESDGVFSVASIRKEIDGNRFQDVSLPTRWVKSVPIKIMRKISSWWNIDYSDVNSYEEWQVWLVSIRIQSKLKGVLEGVYYGLWWYMWNFRNKLLFDKKIPEKALIFDNLVSSSFYWCKFRCKASFKWDDWLKNPYIVLV
ncbi:hypothetical protein Tco_0693093, partial [Tanacetum coccineum]